MFGYLFRLSLNGGFSLQTSFSLFLTVVLSQRCISLWLMPLPRVASIHTCGKGINWISCFFVYRSFVCFSFYIFKCNNVVPFFWIGGVLWCYASDWYWSDASISTVTLDRYELHIVSIIIAWGMGLGPFYFPKRWSLDSIMAEII